MVHLGLADEASALARRADRARRGQGPAVVAGPRRPGGRPDLPRRRRRRVLLRRPRLPPAHPRRLRGRPHRAGLRLPAAPAEAPRRRPAAPAVRAGDVRATSGAVPWADQAAAELRATGETAQRRSATGLDHLTPQELQVARMLAGGRTTREAAAALFLSPKTDRVPPAQRVPEARHPVPRRSWRTRSRSERAAQPPTTTRISLFHGSSNASTRPSSRVAIPRLASRAPRAPRSSSVGSSMVTSPRPSAGHAALRAAALPRVHREVVVVATGGHEQRLRAVLGGDLEADGVDVELVGGARCRRP